MKLLLDTNVFLWLQTEPDRLGPHLKTVADRRNALLLSAASSWEIAIKHRLGRLPLPESPERYVPSRMRAIGAAGLPIEHRHALGVASLPDLHRDPFDRILIAQALAERATILTGDRQLEGYAAETVIVS